MRLGRPADVRTTRRLAPAAFALAGAVLSLAGAARAIPVTGAVTTTPLPATSTSSGAVTLPVAHPAFTAPFVQLPAGGYRLPDTSLTFGPRETERCLYCHALPNFATRDSATHAWQDVWVRASAYQRSQHAEVACTQCHFDVTAYPHRFTPARHVVTCNDECHAYGDDGQPVRHTDNWNEFARSAHGKGLTDPKSGNPTCITCHGAGDPHAVLRPNRGASVAERLATCAGCHADRERMRAAKVDPLATDSYRGSIHYAALRLGEREAPVCQDCHDVHGVRASRDTTSVMSRGHRATTCGKTGCHSGNPAGFFASGASHPGMRIAISPRLRLEERALVVLGGLILALLALGTLLEAQRRWLGPSPDAGRPRIAGADVQRLSLGVRLQHLVLIASFTVLAFTGLPLRFPDVAWLGSLERALGGWDATRQIHRGAAIAMGAIALVHLLLLIAALVRARFRVREAWPMLPEMQDLADVRETVRWWLRLRPEPPAYDRHHWREKVHYFAVAWGVPVMAVTGLVLWFFEDLVKHVLPTNAYVAAMLAHGDEALLAIAIVIVWHFWIVHVSPGRTHRWLTFLDGRVTREYWLTRHGREAERTGETLPPPRTKR